MGSQVSKRIASIVFGFMSFAVLAQPLVNVDSRVDVQFSEMQVGQTVKHFQTFATVTNTSTAPIQAPIRLLISDISKNKTELANPAGLASGGGVYVEIELASGQLESGASSLPTSVEFVRKIGNFEKSKKAGKNKKSGFPTFNFNFSVAGGSPVVISKPSSKPFALSPDTGTVPVAFRVSLQSDGSQSPGIVWLNNLSAGTQQQLNDDGISGDLTAADGIYSVTESINTTSLASGDCLAFTAMTVVNGVDVESALYKLCASTLPLTIDPSDSAPQVTVNGGSAVANEILLFANANASEADVLNLIDSFGGTVIGTLLVSGLYQVQLPAALSAKDLNQLIKQLSANSLVAAAGPNYIGHYTSIPADAEYANQHGMQLVSSDNPTLASPRFVWDASATGSASTVLILDSGVDAGHPDLVVLPENTAGDNTDTLGHGTEMAGLIAASTDNIIGIAGTARNSQMQSVKVSADAIVTEAEMISGFATALPLSGPNTIVNASFSIFGPLIPTAGLCSSIDDLINVGAVVVNSAGNDNNSTTGVWPGMCNDAALDGLHPGDIISTANKSEFIVVAASNCSSGACAADSRKADSNFGGWVDIAAPGVSLPTTTIASVNPSLYSNASGTSAAAALTSAAAAIVRSCGVLTADTFANLDLGASVAVTADFNRINLYDSLAALNVAPSVLAINNTAINELAGPADTTAAPVPVGNLSANAGNICDALSFTIVGGAQASSFIVNGNSLQFDSGVKLDFETRASYDVTVRVTDFFGLAAADLPITVNLNDIVELPPGILFDVDFEAFTVGLAAPMGAGGDRISGADGNLTTTIENAASISPQPALSSGRFARLEESAGEAPDLYFDNGMSFGSGTFSVSMDILVEASDAYHVYIRNGSGAGLAPASQSILNVHHSGNSLSFTSHSGAFSSLITSTVTQAVGVPYNLELSFDLDSLTYDASVDGVSVVTGVQFHTGRADDPIPFIGRVIAGFEFTDFVPQPSGFDGVMQIDNILIQHVP